MVLNRASQAGLWQNPERVTDPAQRRIYESLTTYLAEDHEPAYWHGDLGSNYAVTTNTFSPVDWQEAGGLGGSGGASTQPFLPATGTASYATIPEGFGGVYIVSVGIVWQGDSRGYRRVQLVVLNGSTITEFSNISAPNASSTLHQTITGIVAVSPGDQVGPHVWQNTTANLNVNQNVATRFRGIRVSRLGAGLEGV
jgi:hypothetical protein